MGAVALTSIQLKRLKIGLWGSTNCFDDDPERGFPDGDWRKLATELLLKKGYALDQLYNPDQGENWDALIHPIEEDVVKDHTENHIFFISRKNRSTVSVVEAIASMALGWNTFLIIEDFDATEIRGQQVSVPEQLLLNQMRQFVREVALALGYPVYNRIEDAMTYIPDANEYSSRRRGLTNGQKSNLTKMLDRWSLTKFVAGDILTISQDPIQAMIHSLAVLVVALSSEKENRIIVVNLPNRKLWSGNTFAGIEFVGRADADFGRVYDPYLQDLAERSNKTRVVFVWPRS